MCGRLEERTGTLCLAWAFAPRRAACEMYLLLVDAFVEALRHWVVLPCFDVTGTAAAVLCSGFPSPGPGQDPEEPNQHLAGASAALEDDVAA